jgi:hypothetical protein
LILAADFSDRVVGVTDGDTITAVHLAGRSGHLSTESEAIRRE